MLRARLRSVANRRPNRLYSRVRPFAPPIAATSAAPASAPATTPPRPQSPCRLAKLLPPLAFDRLQRPHDRLPGRAAGESAERGLLAVTAAQVRAEPFRAGLRAQHQPADQPLPGPLGRRCGILNANGVPSLSPATARERLPWVNRQQNSSTLKDFAQQISRIVPLNRPGHSGARTAALKTRALQTLPRVFGDILPREAFGVRSSLAPLWGGG